jgi:hypothetical protein
MGAADLYAGLAAGLALAAISRNALSKVSGGCPPEIFESALREIAAKARPATGPA